MFLELTLTDGILIGANPRFIAHVIPQGEGARITFGDGSWKDVAESLEQVMRSAALAKKEKGPAA